MVNIFHLRLLLLSLTLVLALHAPWQASWVLGVIALLFLWRYRIAVQQKKLPSTWLLLPILAACALGVVLTYGGLAGRDASVALFSLLLALKTMETKSARDLTLLVHLGYFLTVCTFLFSQSITIALLVTLPTLALTITLVAVQQGNRVAIGDAAKTAAGMLGLALPILLALFVLFPRAPGPLWGVPKDATRAMTGLDDEMSPGKISNLSKSSDVAFRVAFHGKPPAQTQLYWRGPVLWSYDGQTWRGGNRQRALGLPELNPRSAPVQYTVTLEPHNRPWLFLLDLPIKPPQTGQTTTAFSTDFELLALQPVRQRIRYDAASSTDYRYGSLSPSERERALQLPYSREPKTRALAQSWAAANADPRAIIQHALDLFRSQFTYTLLAPPLGGNPMDEFLFKTRKGFCEHYAGSFVFLMRAAGVPARVVTGYQGGEFNKLGDYMIVRQTDAHAWAEVWLDGQGWVRVDPTASVMPARVNSGVASALPESEPLPGLARLELTPGKQLNLGWDAINNTYNQWVLGYNQKRQTEFLSRITGSKVTKADLVLWLVGILVMMIGLIALALLRPNSQFIDEPQRLWLRFKRKMASAGMVQESTEGPQNFAERAVAAYPNQREAIRNILWLYLGLRYGNKGGETALKELQTQIKTLILK